MLHSDACVAPVPDAKLLQGKRGELKICDAKSGVKTVLETSGFDSLIKLYDTEKDAIAAFLV